MRAQLGDERAEYGRDVRRHQPGNGARERRDEPRGFRPYVRLRAVLELGDELQQVAPERRQRVRRVPRRQPPDELDRDEPHLGVFVVERDEEDAQALGLGEVPVRRRRGLAERRQHGFAHARVEVAHGHGEEPRDDELLDAHAPPPGFRERRGHRRDDAVVTRRARQAAFFPRRAVRVRFAVR